MVLRQNKFLILVVALVLTGIKFRLSWGLYGPDAFRFSSEARAQESGQIAEKGRLARNSPRRHKHKPNW